MPLWPLGIGLNRIIFWVAFFNKFDRNYDLMAELMLASSTGKAVRVRKNKGSRDVSLAGIHLSLKSTSKMQKAPATFSYDLESGVYLVQQGNLKGFGFNDKLDAIFQDHGYDVPTETAKFLRGYKTLIAPATDQKGFKGPLALGFSMDCELRNADYHGGFDIGPWLVGRGPQMCSLNVGCQENPHKIRC